MVTVTACGTSGIIDAAFGGRGARGASEQDLARVVADGRRMGVGMLVLADGNFSGYGVASVLAATGADLLMRVKCREWLRIMEVLRDGSGGSMLLTGAAGQRAADDSGGHGTRAASLTGLRVSLMHATITITAAGQPRRTEHWGLVATLGKGHVASVADLAACYA